MPIDLLAEEPINLLEEEPRETSFYDLSPENQEKVMEMARNKISQEQPNLPNWLRDALLSLTPKDPSPLLGSASRGMTAVGNYIPQAAAGLLQGASIPIRGISSLIPAEFARNLANSRDLTELAPEPQGSGQKSVQMAAELLGGGGLFGKLMQGVKGASALAQVPKALQNPIALGGAGYLATPGDQMDKALGAGGALLLGGAGNLAGKAAGKIGNNLPEFMRGLTSKSTPEQLVKAVQLPHDKLESTADELYGQVRSAIKNRGVKIPIREENLIKIKDILPSTRATEKLIESARSGDYEAVHDLQSHLYKKGTKGLSSDDIALENQGEEILDLRDKVNDDLERHLLKEGHIDIAHVLKQGKKKVAEIKNTYYAPLLRKGIGKMVQKDLRLIPERPEKLFMQNSVPMKDFLSRHPDVGKHTKGIAEKEKALQDLKKIFFTTGIGGGVMAGTKSLHDLIK